MTFQSERLVELRTKCGMSKSEVARLIHVSPMAYGRYERGERTPSFQTIHYIANALGVSSDYLLGQTDNSSPDTLVITRNECPEFFDFLLDLQKDTDKINRILSYYTTYIKNKGAVKKHSP